MLFWASALAVSLAATPCEVEARGGQVSLLLQEPVADAAAWQAACRRLVDYLQLPQTPWDDSTAAHATDALQRTKDFRSVTCEAEATQLRCTLQPLPMVASTEVVGSLPVALLRSEVRRKLFLRPGHVIPDLDEALRRQQERLRSYLTSEGYFDSEVQVVATPQAGAAPNAAVHIEARLQVGAPSVVGRVRLTGDATPWDARLADAFDHRLFFVGKARFRPASLEDDTARARAILRDHGYVAAALTTHVEK